MKSTFKTQFEAWQFAYFLLPHFISAWCEAEGALCTPTQHLPSYFWSHFIFYFINLSKHLQSRCSTYRLSKSVFCSFTEQFEGNKNFCLSRRCLVIWGPGHPLLQRASTLSSPLHPIFILNKNPFLQPSQVLSNVFLLGTYSHRYSQAVFLPCPTHLPSRCVMDEAPWAHEEIHLLFLNHNKPALYGEGFGTL